MTSRTHRTAWRAAGLLVLFAVLALACGCQTTRRLATRGDLADLQAGQPMTVYGHDDRVWHLRQHVLADSAILGTGTLSQLGATAPFEGRIPFDSIVAVETTSRSAVPVLLAVGVTAILVAAVVSAQSDGGLSVTEQHGYHLPSSGGGGTGTSCPYVYAWNGSGYVLQAEPFGTSWGRAMTATTRHLLPAARAEHGVLRLRLANERLETHYVDAVGVLAIELGRADAAVLDVDGTAWPLGATAAPVAARDAAGRDVRASLAAADGTAWECDPATLEPGSGYEDVVEAAFAVPRGATDGSLVVTAINTGLSAAILAHACRAMGGETARLAHAVETDAALQSVLARYRDDAALEVSLWDGGAWRRAGAFRPEASAIGFTRALRVRVPAGAGDTLRVRLRSMADVWRLDALATDWGSVQPLHAERLVMRSARGPTGDDAAAVLAREDGRDLALLPPDRVELEFAAPPRAHVAYAVEARGYLHEWGPAGEPSSPLAMAIPAEQRIALLTRLLADRDRALGPVYAEWRAGRTAR